MIINALNNNDKQLRDEIVEKHKKSYKMTKN